MSARTAQFARALLAAHDRALLLGSDAPRPAMERYPFRSHRSCADWTQDEADREPRR